MNMVVLMVIFRAYPNTRFDASPTSHPYLQPPLWRLASVPACVTHACVILSNRRCPESEADWVAASATWSSYHDLSLLPFVSGFMAFGEVKMEDERSYFKICGLNWLFIPLNLLLGAHPPPPITINELS